MSPSAEWRSRFGPLDFSVGIRHSQLGGALPELRPSLPDAASEPRRGDSAPGGRVRAAEDDVLAWESEGGTTR